MQISWRALLVFAMFCAMLYVVSARPAVAPATEAFATVLMIVGIVWLYLRSPFTRRGTPAAHRDADPGSN